jgi:hypothetical protein
MYELFRVNDAMIAPIKGEDQHGLGGWADELGLLLELVGGCLRLMDLGLVVDGSGDPLLQSASCWFWSTELEIRCYKVLPAGFGSTELEFRINKCFLLAYFVNQNRGGSSGVGFVIGPRFGEFTTETQFDMDFELDSILPNHKQLVYYMLKAGKIKLDNHFRKITVDSLKSKYKFIFEEKKTMGPPDPEWNGEKKTLASYTLSYRRGDYDPSILVSEHYISKDNYYDMYISDGLIIPGQYGDYGYLVVVTESLGFEGVIRKTFEIVALGSLND